MADAFGVDTDIWIFADTNVSAQSATPADPSATEAQVEDSKGDVAESTMHDTTSSVSAAYKAINDTAFVFYDTTTAVDFRLGVVISGHVITQIEVGTDNKDRPTCTISGQSTTASDSDVAKYQTGDLEIAGTRKATSIGATEDSLASVVGSSATASVSVTKVLDSDGEEVALDVYGGRIEASNDLVGVGGTPGATADTGWTLSAGPSENQENTGYATGTISVFKNIAADT